MEYSFAPMEGITGYVFRRAHHQVFPDTDAYYLPFAMPTENRCFSDKELRDLAPEHNAGMQVIPQLMGKNGEVVLQAIRELAEMGYKEVNLNFGCPSQTVVTKGKGAGILKDPAEMDRFLDTIFSGSPIPVSVKSRLGIAEPEEFDNIMQVYRKYPLKRLILHPRVQKDQYRLPVRPEAFAAAYARRTWPMVYNGDLKTPEKCAEIGEQFPELEGLMIGRGLLRNPGLIHTCKTGEPVTKEQIREFHDRYYTDWGELAYGDKQLLAKMKELWAFLITSFPGMEDAFKRIKKCNRAGEYESIVAGIFRDGKFSP